MYKYQAIKLTVMIQVKNMNLRQAHVNKGGHHVKMNQR